MTTSYVAAAAGETVLVEIETTPGGGVFASPASINLQRSIELKASADATVIPRSDDPSKPGYTSRTVTAIDWTCQGQGVTNIGEDKTYADMLISGAPRAIRISNANTGGLVLTGQGVITAFSPMNSGGLGKKAEFSITIEGAGPVTTAAHA